MSDAVKPNRTYRQQQAQVTRDRIASAARRLFAVHGYRMTTMTAIAEEAGVAPRTVYSAFGAKREILSTICERWIADAHAVEIVAAAVAEPDPTKTVGLAARFLRALFETGYDVAQLFEAASADDEMTRAMLRKKLEARNAVQGEIVASIRDHLTIPLPVAQTIYRALATTGIYQELVVESGWSNDRYEQWIVAELGRQFLATPSG